MKHMSLKQYFFLLVSLLVAIMSITQVAFIYWMQDQLDKEISQKSQKISEQMVDLVVEKLHFTEQPDTSPSTHQHAEPQISVSVSTSSSSAGTPEMQLQELKDVKKIIKVQTDQAPVFITQNAIREKLTGELAKISVSNFSQSHVYAITNTNDKNFKQRIVEFKEQDSTLNQYLQSLIWITLAIGISGLILAYWLSHHASRPLALLTNGFAEIKQGKLGTQLAPEGVEEIKTTINQFNQMSARLKELNQKEHLFQQHQQMAELGEISRGLAHTLRNPINTIGLTIEQMSQPQLDETQRLAMAQQVRDKITVIDKNLKALLSLTAADVDRQQRVDLNKVIQDIGLEVQITSGRTLQLPKAENASVTGSESELRAILHTLIINAVEASSEDDPITISIAKGETKICVEVKDQGSGLSPAIKHKLFQPHVTTKSEGAGMGLYIARRLCKIHYQGDICLEDNQPKGCIAIACFNYTSTKTED
jgi:signal transduction histidine kinase